MISSLYIGKLPNCHMDKWSIKWTTKCQSPHQSEFRDIFKMPMEVTWRYSNIVVKGSFNKWPWSTACNKMQSLSGSVFTKLTLKPLEWKLWNHYMQSYNPYGTMFTNGPLHCFRMWLACWNIEQNTEIVTYWVALMVKGYNHNLIHDKIVINLTNYCYHVDPPA